MRRRATPLCSCCRRTPQSNSRILAHKEIKEELVKQFEQQETSRRSYLNICRTKTMVLGQTIKANKASQVQIEIQRMKDELGKKEQEINAITRELEGDEEIKIVPMFASVEPAKRNASLVRKMAKSAETGANSRAATQQSRALLSNKSNSFTLRRHHRTCQTACADCSNPRQSPPQTNGVPHCAP